MRIEWKQGLTEPALAAAIVALTAAMGGVALAESAGGEPAPAPKCLKAEVNPVTGHVLCIDPIGAPVDPPPAASEAPCKPDARSDQAWTWGPKCKSEKPGEG
jgi:hypothetical protein